jgi:hypothetical protein
MPSEIEKEEQERAAFDRFAKRSGQPGVWLRVESRKPQEPDLLCTHAVWGHVAFELVRICDPYLAKVQAAGATATHPALPTSPPSERIVRNKLGKNYVTQHPIELLIYTDGQIVTSDDAIIPSIVPWFDAIPHPFRRVWFMGETVIQCLWSAAQAAPERSPR